MDQNSLLSMLLQAYHDERAADAFYTHLLGETEDFEAVDALAEARRDERKHARWIWALILTMTGSPPQEITPHIPAHQNFEEAIRIALAGEREAIEFYAGIIRMAESPEVKNIFFYIREDEIVHALKFEALLVELAEENGPAAPPAFPPNTQFPGL